MLLYELIQEDRDALSNVALELKLPKAELNLLRHLVPGATATMISLARVLRCDDSNVTGLVDKLEERGLIERRGDPNDRRVKLVVLTDAGQAVREDLLERLSVPLPFIQRLTASDKRALRDILRRATKAKPKAPPARGPEPGRGGAG
jgi:DNA-binding MarR family transcriptional regulator